MLDFPNLAYLVGGFVLLLGIILLILFLKRRRRVSSTGSVEGAFENEVCAPDDYNEVNNAFQRSRSAYNMLYMTNEEFQDSLNKENNEPLTNVTEC